MKIQTNLRELEQALFDQFTIDERIVSPIFILGAPRTGSTVLYQVMINSFSLPYISNVANQYFFKTPIIGIAVTNGKSAELSLESFFGKTEGLFSPSEASSVMKKWFGGGHPSQILSKEFLPEQRKHFKKTLLSCQAMLGAPLIIKNAWNCFRIKALADTFNNAKFIWIRRDIRSAAVSDLEARYVTKGNPNLWNSATPANLEQLKKYGPEVQVVENQVEFNCAIEIGLREFAKDRYVSVWYEDLCTRPEHELQRLGNFLMLERRVDYNPQLSMRSSIRLEGIERSGVASYAAQSYDRLGKFFYSNGEKR